MGLMLSLATATSMVLKSMSRKAAGWLQAGAINPDSAIMNSSSQRDVCTHSSLHKLGIDTRFPDLGTKQTARDYA